jgi:hypothetical protein
MLKQSDDLAIIVATLARVEKERESAITEAFSALECQSPALASMLLMNFGNRRRAALWMCMTQRSLDGRNAYKALAEGDVDSVWEALTGSGEQASDSPTIYARSVG